MSIRQNYLLLLAATGLLFGACSKHNSETKSIQINQDNVTEITKGAVVNGVTKSGSHLLLSNYWIRPSLGENTATGGYITIKNKGPQDDRFVSASCECAKSVALHTMTMNGSMMEMDEAKDGFVVKAGETITLAPGGNHIMLTGVKTGLQEGTHQDLVLHFEKAGDVVVKVPVNDGPAEATKP